MDPHPQSRASLLALHDNLRREALSRARVYAGMTAKLQHDHTFMKRLELERQIFAALNLPIDHDGPTARMVRSAIGNPANEGIWNIVNEINDEVSLMVKARNLIDNLEAAGGIKLEDDDEVPADLAEDVDPGGPPVDGQTYLINGLNLKYVRERDSFIGTDAKGLGHLVHRIDTPYIGYKPE